MSDATPLRSGGRPRSPASAKRSTKRSAMSAGELGQPSNTASRGKETAGGEVTAAAKVKAARKAVPAGKAVVTGKAARAPKTVPARNARTAPAKLRSRARTAARTNEPAAAAGRPATTASAPKPTPRPSPGKASRLAVAPTQAEVLTRAEIPARAAVQEAPVAGATIAGATVVTIPPAHRAGAPNWLNFTSALAEEIVGNAWRAGEVTVELVSGWAELARAFYPVINLEEASFAWATGDIFDLAEEILASQRKFAYDLAEVLLLAS